MRLPGHVYQVASPIVQAVAVLVMGYLVAGGLCYEAVHIDLAGQELSLEVGAGIPRRAAADDVPVERRKKVK